MEPTHQTHSLQRHRQKPLCMYVLINLLGNGGKQKDDLTYHQNYVLPVQKALQGHPESARLWADLIHGILKEKLNLQECKHEQCLYRGIFKGTEVLFLRQVDDFCVAAETQEIADEIIEVINKAMSIDIKHLGLITRFNGMDLLQTKHYIKLYTKTYIAKILDQHGWTEPIRPSLQPVPMNYDSSYQRNLELARPPALAEDKIKL